MPNQIVWCDIPVADLDRAIRFYSALIGQAVRKQEYSGFAIGLLPGGGPDSSGCLYIPENNDNRPGASGPLVYMNCSGRLDDAIAKVESHGGKVVQAKHQIGDHGFRAVILDSEGNRIALHSM
ncbi:MAG TPA: VOC family protein [Candidatus Acidoferrales bacterium]|nr:VOC family protein [Candidatus Acidoferrales bacterium]